MPRSFLVKKAKYANDYGNSSSKQQQHQPHQQHSFYRQASPTEGETAPNAVHHYSTSITTNRFSYGKFLFFIQFFVPSFHLCNRMILLKVSAVAVCLVLQQSYFSSTKTASLHLNYSIELAEWEGKVASEMLHCNDALIYVRSFTNLVDINHRSLAMAPLIFD